jgi:hypothetical protein
MWKHIRFSTISAILDKKAIVLPMFLFYIGVKTSSCSATGSLPFCWGGSSAMILLIINNLTERAQISILPTPHIHE